MAQVKSKSLNYRVISLVWRAAVLSSIEWLLLQHLRVRASFQSSERGCIATLRGVLQRRPELF